MRENKWWRCKRTFLYQAVQGNSHKKNAWKCEIMNSFIKLCTCAQSYFKCSWLAIVYVGFPWWRDGEGRTLGMGLCQRWFLKLLYKRPKGDLSPSPAIRHWKRTLARKEAHTKRQHDINHSVWYFVFWLKRLGAGHVNYVETCSLKSMGTCVSDTWDNKLLM